VRWSTGADVIGLPVADERPRVFRSFDNVLRALDRKSDRSDGSVHCRYGRHADRCAQGYADCERLSRSAPAFFLKDGTPAGELPGRG